MPRPCAAPAFDLAFNERGIDGAAHVMRGGDLQNFDGAEFGVHLDFSKVRAETEYGVGNTLAVTVERRNGWIEGGLGARNVPARVERHFAQANVFCLAFVL